MLHFKTSMLALSMMTTFTLSSCVTHRYSAKDRLKTNRIERGLTKDQVIAIMHGLPLYRSFDEDNNERWEYRNKHYWDNDDVILIFFYRNRVVRMNSFKYESPERIMNCKNDSLWFKR